MKDFFKRSNKWKVQIFFSLVDKKNQVSKISIFPSRNHNLNVVYYEKYTRNVGGICKKKS